MRPQRAISEEGKAELAYLLKTVKNKDDFQRVQCLWLRASKGFTASEVAAIVGLQEGYVKQIWSNYFKQGTSALIKAKRGGRHRQNLSESQEIELLKPFLKPAETGGVLVVWPIHEAYEKLVGFRVPKSTIYRMLERQGWRKIQPRPRHPKNDPSAAEEFKKNSKSI